MNKSCYFCWLIGWLVMPIMVRADLIIEVKDAIITSGSTGHVDVYIHSSGTDSVQFANYTFQITTPTGQVAPGVLAFNPVQSFQEQSSQTPPYIFAGDTDVTFLTKNLDGPVRLTGFDFTSSATDVTLDTSNRLLTRLELIHTGAGLEGKFRISLVQNNLLSFFLNANGDPVAIDPSSFSSSGVITASISAVPEPSTCFLSAGLIAAIVARRRRKV